MKLKGKISVAVGVGTFAFAMIGQAPRAIAATDDVTTFVGGPPPAAAGFADGAGLAARFNNPKGLARDAVGNVFIADYGNNRIRMMTPAGVVSTVAGSGLVGTANGPAATATFDRPRAVATNGTALFVVEDGSNRIRMIASGQVTDFAGGAAGSSDGPFATARFDHPSAVAFSSGALYVQDYFSVRRLNSGVSTTLLGCTGGNALNQLGAEASQTASCVQQTNGMLAESNGSFYFADLETIRRFDATGGTSTRCAAGQHAALFRPGQLPQSTPDLGLTSIPLYSSSAGNISSAAPVVSFKLSITHARVADIALRLRAPNGTSVPLALNRGSSGANFSSTTFVSAGAPAIGSGSAPYNGSFLPEPGSFSMLQGASVTAGTPWFLDITDSGTATIGTVTALDLMVCVDGSAPLVTHVESFLLASFGGLATAANGSLYWSVFQPGALISRIMTTVNGLTDRFTGPAGPIAAVHGYLDGPRLQALFRYPSGVVVADDGSLLIADSGNNVIRRIDQSPPDTIAPTGVITSPSAAGQMYQSKPIVLSGTASDNVGVVTVEVAIERIMSVFDYWNGIAWQSPLVYLPAAGVTPGLTTNWSYSFNPPQSGGRFYVFLKLTDAAGNSWTSGGRDFVLPDSTPPTTAFTNPLNGAVAAAGKTMAITGIASDNSSVYSVPISIQRVSDGAYFQGVGWQPTFSQIATTLWTPGSPTTKWSRSFVPPSPGSYIITARPYDGNGNQTLVAITVTAT